MEMAAAVAAVEEKVVVPAVLTEGAVAAMRVDAGRLAAGVAAPE